MMFLVCLIAGMLPWFFNLSTWTFELPSMLKFSVGLSISFVTAITLTVLSEENGHE